MNVAAAVSVDTQLQRFETELKTWTETATRTESPTAEMVQYHLGYTGGAARQGKRLRPRILLAVTAEESIDAAYERNITDAVAAACAIELVHNYSLIHDDIEDEDELRHGRQTVWSKYGVAHGINAGDAMCAVSYLALLRPGRISTPTRAAAMTHALHEAHLSMCWGQGLDLSFEHARTVSFAEYSAMIEGKTAALFGAACGLGALASDASAERVAAYTRMGCAYGRAFQIQDDILGIWGLTKETGKPSGADLQRRKWSFPVVWALSHGDAHTVAPIRAAYEAGAPLDQATVAIVMDKLDALGARAAAAAAAQAALTAAETECEHARLDRTERVRTLLRTTLGRQA